MVRHRRGEHLLGRRCEEDFLGDIAGQLVVAQPGAHHRPHAWQEVRHQLTLRGRVALGNQGHPEFKSRPTRPAPLFRDFVGAAVAFKKGHKG